MVFRRRRTRSSSPVPAGYEPLPAYWDRQEQGWREGIAQHGWLIQSILGDGDRPGFHFTVGLTERGLAELIVYGLHSDLGGHALNDVAQRLMDGERFADGEVVPGVLEGDYRTQLWGVTWLQDPLGAAFRLYGQDAVEVRQLVIPDLENRMPWEDDYADLDIQPLLFVAPGGQGPRRAGPEARDDSHHVGPEDWDLPQDPHVSVVVSTSVSSGALPALLLVHEHDGEWQILDGVGEPDRETVELVCLHCLVEADATLRAVLKTLPAGHEASREAVGAQWSYQPYAEK